MEEYIRGTFVKELKNRFLCLVRIDNKDELCYVPSSCHLSNFLDLKGKEVMLIPNKSKETRTKFSVYAVPYKKNYIVLNTSKANEAVEECIRSRRFSFLGKRSQIEKEYKYNGYKCDFFVCDTETIIEVKSIISTQEVARFPTVYSERGIRQLKQLYTHLQDGKNALYCIVSLHPYVKQIELDSESEWFCELKKCMDLGLKLKAFSSRLTPSCLKVDKELEVLY